MTFKELFPSFIAGTPIKRKAWGGYWKFNNTYREPIIFTKEGDVLPFHDITHWDVTLLNILSDDWEVATNENCDIEVI